MPTVSEIEQALFRLAPKELAMAWDNVGHLEGNPKQSVQRLLVALDVTEAVVSEAEEKGCQLIISHHPLMNVRWHEKELQSLQKQTKEQRTAALTVQEIRSMGKKTITGNITLTPSECSTLKDYAVNGILAKAENSRLEEKLQSAQKSAAVWKQRYEKIYDKYQELKKEVQPYLDAVKLAPEKVRAFLDAILTRTRQTRQHDQPSRRKSQDIEL